MLRWMAGLSFSFLFGTLPLVAAQPSAQPQTCSLHLQITDEDGGAIRAFVLIHSDRSLKINQQVPVDANGKLKAALRPGIYDLFVAAAGFVPIAQIHDLRSCKPQSLNIMMTFDAEHAPGDKF